MMLHDNNPSHSRHHMFKLSVIINQIRIVAPVGDEEICIDSFWRWGALVSRIFVEEGGDWRWWQQRDSSIRERR